MAPGLRIVLRRADREAGDGADDDPEQDVAEPSSDGDAEAYPRFDCPLARWRWVLSASHVSRPFPVASRSRRRPTHTPVGCRSLSGRLACGNAAATGVRSWRDASQPAATRFSRDPIAAGLVLARGWVG